MSRSIHVALIRHAPTAWTVERRVQGRGDHPLSSEGEAQAARWRLPDDLARHHATGRLAWAVSPLRRALETARHLGAVAPVVEPRLLEMHYGAWEGLTHAEVDALTEHSGWDDRPPGGESPAEVLARVRAWLDDLAIARGPDTWVAVTHGGVIRVLLAAAIDWDLRPPAPWRLVPERVHRIRRRGDGHLQLVTLNEPLVPL
ncbi:MAG: histidine phosphatase family protein [Candidatus Rokuibacteriota bacterium]